MIRLEIGVVGVYDRDEKARVRYLLSMLGGYSTLYILRKANEMVLRKLESLGIKTLC